MFALKLKKKIERLDFIFGGVQKGRTSALDCDLDQHHNVTMAHPEEAHMIDHPRRHFFDDEKRYAADNFVEMLRIATSERRRRDRFVEKPVSSTLQAPLGATLGTSTPARLSSMPLR
jgi:hypothetical protein